MENEEVCLCLEVPERKAEKGRYLLYTLVAPKLEYAQIPGTSTCSFPGQLSWEGISGNDLVQPPALNRAILNASKDEDSTTPLCEPLSTVSSV